MIQTRQMILTKYGGPEVFQEVETGIAELRDGEVLIRTHFAGINDTDIMARKGLNPEAPPLPMVLGFEVSGIAASVGQGVESIAEGDSVLALTQFGGYSSHVVVPQRHVRKVPENVSLEAAAALPVSYITAYLMLFRMGSLMGGDTVLVHNGAGAIGTAIITLARMKGARVYATASRDMHERVRDLGAKEVIDFNQQDFVTEIMRITGGLGVDLVLDAGGLSQFVRSYQVLAPLGKLVMYGVQDSFGPGKVSGLFGLAWRGWRLKFKPIHLMNQNHGVLGVNLGHLWNYPELVDSALSELVTWAGDEQLIPEIDHVYTYVRVGEAHEYVHGRQNFGKVLLDFRALTQKAAQVQAQI